jgi:hypothetical protein
MPTPVTLRPISGIKDIRDRSIVVEDIETGKDLRLPKQHIDFRPGLVVIPVWLARKIFNECK